MYEFCMSWCTFAGGRVHVHASSGMIVCTRCAWAECKHIGRLPVWVANWDEAPSQREGSQWEEQREGDAQTDADPGRGENEERQPRGDEMRRQRDAARSEKMLRQSEEQTSGAGMRAGGPTQRQRFWGSVLIYCSQLSGKSEGRDTADTVTREMRISLECWSGKKREWEQRGCPGMVAGYPGHGKLKQPWVSNLRSLTEMSCQLQKRHIWPLRSRFSSCLVTFKSR